MNLYAAQTRWIQLDETSWIEHTPGCLGREDAEELLAKLIANAAWEQHRGAETLTGDIRDTLAELAVLFPF
jgi:hypothetical protein